MGYASEDRSFYLPTASAGFLKSVPNEHQSSGKTHKIILDRVFHISYKRGAFPGE
jgi:hypothetical protein